MKNVPEALDRSTELLTVERLETAYKTALASAESLEEVGKIRDSAEVFHLDLKYHGTGGDLQNLACEIKARADRWMGEMITTLDCRPDRTSSQDDMRSNSRPNGMPGEDDERMVEEFGDDAESPEIARTPLAQILADLAIGPMEA